MKSHVFLALFAATLSLGILQTEARADAGSAESSSAEVGPGGGGDGGFDDGTISTEGANPNIDADLEGGLDSSGHTGPGGEAGPGGDAGAKADAGTTDSGGGCSVIASSDEGSLEGFALLVGVSSLVVARRSKTRPKPLPARRPG